MTALQCISMSVKPLVRRRLPHVGKLVSSLTHKDDAKSEKPGTSLTLTCVSKLQIKICLCDPMQPYFYVHESICMLPFVCIVSLRCSDKRFKHVSARSACLDPKDLIQACSGTRHADLAWTRLNRWLEQSKPKIKVIAVPQEADMLSWHGHACTHCWSRATPRPLHPSTFAAVCVQFSFALL